MSIAEIISSRLQLMGTSQALIVKMIRTNPTQLNAFLKEKDNGTLSKPTLEKLLTVTGINLDIYEKRNKLVDQVATFLSERGIKQKELEKWSKSQLAFFTGINDLELLIDVNDVETYDRMIKSNLVDVESTFPYFKAMVAYRLNLTSEKITASTANKALKKTIGEEYDDSMYERLTPAILTAALTGVKAIGAGGIITANPIVVAAGVIGGAILGGVAGVIKKPEQAQKGAICLFEKGHKNSLNVKAIEYVKAQDKDSKESKNDK